MHLYSLLFIAVLYACSVTSSTRSLSTSVRRLNSKRGGYGADLIEVETIKEERAWDFSAFSDFLNKVHTRSPQVGEKTLLTILNFGVNNPIEAYAFLRYIRDKSQWLRDVQAAVWPKYLESAPALTKEATRAFFTHHQDDRIVEMLDALTEAKAKDEMMKVYEDQLIKHWFTQGKTPEDVFETLKLKGIKEPDSLTGIERLKVWISFTEQHINRPISSWCHTYHFRDRVNILDGLRRIGDKHNTQRMETQLVRDLRMRNGPYETEIVEAFKDLKLDGKLDGLLGHPNVKLFDIFAGKFLPEHSLTESFILASRQVYGDSSLLNKFRALSEIGDESGLLLRNELNRQFGSSNIRYEHSLFT